MEYFYEGFISIVDKHAPFQRLRVKGRDNAWFTPELANLLQQTNQAWAKARQSGTDLDRLSFRQLRNRCTFLIKKAKSDFYLAATTENLTIPGNSGKP